MSRLRAITERDRIAEATDALERGETVDWQKIAALQANDVVEAGRAALLDALDREDKADEDFGRTAGGEH